jgi:hypothetical protein
MESNMLNDGASVSSSFHTHSTDVSTSNNFPTIRLNSVTGAYIDEVYSCFQNPVSKTIRILKKFFIETA